jgi:Ser/Thr protein kinase RdoA (MazF antagonist)
VSTARPAFPVVESTLAPDALAQLVRYRYNFNGGVTCTFIKRGTNDTSLIRVGEQRAILRAYPHGWRTREQIEEELAALDHLIKARVPVSHAILSRDGERIHTVAAPEGERHLVLFTYANGDFGTFDDAHLFALGQSLAEIHVGSAGFAKRSTRMPLDGAQLIGSAVARLDARVNEPAGKYLHEIGSRVVQSLSALRIEPPQFGVCHGDFAGFNTHVDEHGHQTHFDFDFCGFGWRAYDLAVMLWSRHKIAGPTLAPKQFACFLEGYESIRKLSDDERRSIPYFVLCREMFIMGVALQNLNRFPRRPSEDPVAGCVDFLKRWIDENDFDC